jgi:hypothetical protein
MIFLNCSEVAVNSLWSSSSSDSESISERTVRSSKTPSTLSQVSSFRWSFEISLVTPWQSSLFQKSGADADASSLSFLSLIESRSKTVLQVFSQNPQFLQNSGV